MSEGCEDGRLHRGSCWVGPNTLQIDSDLMATKTKNYTKGCARKNTSPSTQWTDSGLRVMKTYGNTESCARRKEDSLEVGNNNIELVTKKVSQRAQTDPGLRAAKRDNNAEGNAKGT